MNILTNCIHYIYTVRSKKIEVLRHFEYISKSLLFVFPAPPHFKEFFFQNYYSRYMNTESLKKTFQFPTPTWVFIPYIDDATENN